MANDLTKYPLVIDAASDAALLTSTFRVVKLRWIGATTAGHLAIVQDQNGNLFWESQAVGAGHIDESDFGVDPSNRNILNGLRVPILSSGKLFIYF